MFEKEFAQAKQCHLNIEKDCLQKSANNTEHQKKFRKAKFQELENKAALFRPTAPYLSLIGLKIDFRQAASLGLVEGTHSESNAILQILRHSWAPIFGNTSFDKVAAMFFEVATKMLQG